MTNERISVDTFRELQEVIELAKAQIDTVSHSANSVLFGDPVTKSGYIVACETMPVDDFNMPCYEVITPQEYPNIYNIFWYMQRAYKGYNWQIITK